MVARNGSSVRVRMSAGLVVLTLVWVGSGLPARASAPDEAVLSAAELTQMEQRAAQAQPREQCYLYAQLLHALTEAAGRQMAAGQEEAVKSTMKQIDNVAEKIGAAAGKNAKRLKNAEELLDHTHRRLSDMMRVAPTEERTAVQSALQRLDGVHSNVLALVFAP